MCATGTELASSCTVTLVLAGAGFLHGRRATTHWIARELLSRRYAQVELVLEPITVDQGRIITSGGAPRLHGEARRSAPDPGIALEVQPNGTVVEVV